MIATHHYSAAYPYHCNEKREHLRATEMPDIGRKGSVGACGSNSSMLTVDRGTGARWMVSLLLCGCNEECVSASNPSQIHAPGNQRLINIKRLLG